MLDKRILNFLVIIVLSLGTFWWTFFIFHISFDWKLVGVVIALRILASIFIFKDYSLSWSKASQKSFIIKSIVNIIPFALYMPFFYGEYRFAFMASELFFYLFCINFAMYFYYYYINKTSIRKDKRVIVYGAGKAGIKIEEEFRNSEYLVRYFCDDDKIIQGRSIDGVRIVAPDELKQKLSDTQYDLLIIAMPSASKNQINTIYNNFSNHFKNIKILPSLDSILHEQNFSNQLKDISVEDLLARHPKDLDTKAIKKFIGGKKVLITGAGGSIGSEISRQCVEFEASELILLDHSEFNLYSIAEELQEFQPILVMQSVSNK